jgi:hypothetical protein
MWTRHRTRRPATLERRGWRESAIVARAGAAGERLHRPWPRRGHSGSPPPRVNAAHLLGRPWPLGAGLAQRLQSRRRAHPWARRLAIGAAVGLALVVGLALSWALTTPALRLQRIRVDGTDDPALVTAIQALPITGCIPMLCDTARAAHLVERLPQVAHARVWVAAADTLAVRVVPRAPALLWRVADHAVLVAADGVVIAAASSADRARLPAVSDASGAALALSRAQPGARLPAALVELATQLLDGLPRLVGPDVALRYDPDTGLVADTGHGLAIVFGDPSRPPNDMPAGAAGQLAELQILLQTLDQRKERATWIDLRWGTHPAYRLA